MKISSGRGIKTHWPPRHREFRPQWPLSPVQTSTAQCSDWTQKLWQTQTKKVYMHQPFLKFLRSEILDYAPWCMPPFWGEKGMRKLQELFDDFPIFWLLTWPRFGKNGGPDKLIDEALMVANQEAKAIPEQRGAPGKSSSWSSVAHQLGILWQKPRSYWHVYQSRKMRRILWYNLCWNSGQSGSCRFGQIRGIWSGSFGAVAPSAPVELRLGGLENRCGCILTSITLLLLL